MSPNHSAAPPGASDAMRRASHDDPRFQLRRLADDQHRAVKPEAIKWMVGEQHGGGDDVRRVLDMFEGFATWWWWGSSRDRWPGSPRRTEVAACSGTLTLGLGGSLMGSALFPVLGGSPEAAWFVMAPVMLVGRPLSSRFSAQCGRRGSSGASSSRAARSAARVGVTPPNIVMLEGGKRTTRPFRCLSAPREGPRRGSDGAAVMQR